MQASGEVGSTIMFGVQAHWDQVPLLQQQVEDGNSAMVV
jgi:hypothetical protein